MQIFTRWVNQSELPACLFVKSLPVTHTGVLGCDTELQPKKIQIQDCIKGFENGLELVALIEALSEKTCTYKMNPKPNSKMTKIDNCNNALKFLSDCGVVMELKPSAENLVDGGAYRALCLQLRDCAADISTGGACAEEKQVLGMIWGVMRTFLKFGDEDNKMSAQDALKMWCQNQVCCGLRTCGGCRFAGSPCCSRLADCWLQGCCH
jgi:hypothetical protein